MNEEWELEKKTYEDTIKLLKQAVYDLQKSNDDYELKEMYRDYIEEYGDINEKLISLVEFKENYFGDMEKCSMCGHWFIKDDMVDTEKVANGGIGLICNSCADNL